MRGTEANIIEAPPLEELAQRINAAHAAFERSGTLIEYAIEAGTLLVVAKAQVGHGKWLPWLEEHFDGSERTARNYMLVSERQETLNRQRVADLSLRAAIKFITKEAHAAGETLPGPETADVPPPSADYRSSDLADFIKAGLRYSTVYADPAWQYGNQTTRGSTDNHYGTMALKDICRLPIADIAADDAHLHLWTTTAFLFDARLVMKHWGFTFKSCLIWVKPQMGMGNYWRQSHEYLLLGVRGDATRFRVRDEMSWVEAPRGEHSAKPEIFRSKIERVSLGPYIELFSRRAVPGWSAWGNEIERSLFT